MKPHTHSNIARNIVKGLIVGKLQDAGTFSGKIQSQYEISPQVKVFTMKLDVAD